MTNRKIKFLSSAAPFDNGAVSMMMVQGSVVQITYAPQMQPGLEGMIVDQMPYSTGTWTCETTAGIGFGRAVSQGAGDGGCVIGGSSATKFLGLTQRDVTLALVNSDPLSNALNTVDTYGLRTNVAVMSVGHMWVTAGENVAAGDPVWFNSVSGLLSNVTGGSSATANITFTGNPLDATSVTLNGSAPIVFKNTVATPTTQCQIGPTLGDTLVNLAAFINANPGADANIGFFKASAFPGSPGGAGQGSGANQLLLAVKAAGVAGNAYTVATTAAGTTVSGGGVVTAGVAGTWTQITGARWATSSMAGQLAQVALAFQT